MTIRSKPPQSPRQALGRSPSDKSDRKSSLPSPRRPEMSGRSRVTASGFAWQGLVAGVGGLLLILVLILGGRALFTSKPAPVVPSPTFSSATPDTVATSVAATLQAIATSSAGTTPAPTSSSATLGITSTVIPDVTAPTSVPATLIPDLTIAPAIQVDVQRDSEVDAVTGMATWTEAAAQSELSVLFRRADGTPLDKYVRGYHQGSDVSGNPVPEGSYIFAKWTGDDGIVTVPLPPDTYILKLDVAGWPWTTQVANHIVAAGQRTNILFDMSLLTVGVRYADGSPADKFIQVYLQTTDVSGMPVEGDSVEDGWTGEDGLRTFEVTPGMYALKASGVAGYDTWGRFDHDVPGGGNYTVILTLGRLSVETWAADGSLATDVYVQVYELAPDSRGISVLADSVENQRSDNTGKATFDLAPGLYGVQVGRDLEFVDVPVQPGQTTTVNRSGYVVP